MPRFRFLILLTLVLAALFWATGNASAATDKPGRCGKNITDKAGRVHARAGMTCIGTAERKAVAVRRAKAIRVAAVKKGQVKR